jgi:excisionase family DNA binding protein
MGNELIPPQLKGFLDLLADLLVEKCFERIDGRIKKIPELKRLITAKEAGQYLSISTETIYRLVSLKRLPYIKIGDRVLFDIKALDRWIERNMIKEKEFKKREIKSEDQNERLEKKTKESDLFGVLKKGKKD